MMSLIYNVGLVAGAFELIHPGYVRLLKDAKSICKHLVVALHEDPALERPNSKFHPVLSVEERTEILLSIRYVDEVRTYKTEDGLVALILDVHPDVRILGSDYTKKDVTGRMGIPIYYHVRHHNWSTTKLRRLIAQSMKGRML
jgi:glycerol-3-phosphate cytidylyltransferase